MLSVWRGRAKPEGGEQKRSARLVAIVVIFVLLPHDAQARERQRARARERAGIWTAGLSADWLAGTLRPSELPSPPEATLPLWLTVATNVARGVMAATVVMATAVMSGRHCRHVWPPLPSCLAATAGWSTLHWQGWSLVMGWSTLFRSRLL